MFNVLRSKQQLGYSVHSSVRLTHGVLGFAIVIVSGGRHAPAAHTPCPSWALGMQSACARRQSGNLHALMLQL